MRRKDLPWAIAILLADFSGNTVGASDLAPLAVTIPGSPPTNSSLADFNLPENFTQLIADRMAIDRYQRRYHQVEAGVNPAPTHTLGVKNREERFVRVLSPQSGAGAMEYRGALTNNFVPLRGFRAPILERAGDRPPAVLPAMGLSDTERKAADRVARRLASDGLLYTLAHVIEILGPAKFNANSAAGLEAITALGFPSDLLACFPLGSHSEGTNDLVAVAADVARKLTAGATPESLKPEFNARSFRFQRARPEFQVATESGENELGLVRMQAGGGYRNGIIPGESIDVICQLVAALPGADFIITVPNDVLEPFHWLATCSWRLRRAHQVTLIGENLPIAPWAQDNGKAGLTAGEAPGTMKFATLASRYACMNEGQSQFHAGESFLMDGLQAAGHAVVHSSLLFQGGNLMAVRNPKSGERLLLIGEGELYRNTALGFTRAQALEAFRAEFGVDRCVALPAVSYHLDFDVCVRAQGGELIAFVNDTMAAARVILGLGITALELHGALDTRAARAARADFASGRDFDLHRSLTNAVQRQLQGRPDFPASLSKYFLAGKMDSAAGNLQCFLLALDLLENSLAHADLATVDRERREYLLALRRLEATGLRQTDELRKLGWTVIPVPSMTDLFRSINYLNGIQHRDGYVMPVFAGFYAPLDHAALAAFRRALGADLRITPVRSAECQRLFGGVHCTAAAYPRL